MESITTNQATRTISAHKILSKDTLTFSPELYSRFKYGSKSAARTFGYELAVEFIKSSVYQELIFTAQQVVVLSSPYSFIPTATFAMKDYFIAALNRQLISDGLSPVQETKLVRQHSYIEDYGQMQSDERLRLIMSESFHIDAMFVKNKYLLFLDDVRITGAHQQGLEHMIAKLGIEEDFNFLYYAELVQDIDPTIENFLNYYSVRDLVDLNHIIRDDEFMFNTRCIKFMLNSDSDQFNSFIVYQSRTFAETMLTLSIGNSYHLIPAYKTNFSTLKQLVDEYNY